MTEIGHRVRRLVSFLVLVLLVTGLINVNRVGLLNFSEGWWTAYGMTVAVKVSLALGLFGAFPFLFVVVHRNGSDELEARITRMNYLHWGISILTLVIMFLGILL